MFKIQENGDGSTSIFCSQTGRLICTIKSQQRNMGLGCRPVNVVEPSPQPRLHSILDSNSECSSDDNKLDSRKRSISPIWKEVKEDFSDDCITPEEFARCINLVPTEKLKNVPLDELRASFPLRHLSRSKAFRASDDLPDIKISDDIPLTSSLGLKILDCNKTRNYYSSSTIEMKIKHYDSFCRFQLNTPTACSNFPKLRCREKKDYPVYFPQKSMKFSCHTYAFNRRQRLEKIITFKTGLNARGRKLLLQCNKRLVISLKKLTTEETQLWLSKRSSFMRPITMDCIKDEEPLIFLSDSEATVINENYVEPIPFVNLETSDSDSSSSSDDDTDYSPPKISLHNKIVSFKGVLNKSGKCLPRNRNAQFSKLVKNRCKLKDCHVQLNDIINQISEHLGNFYVTGTNIHIPFLSNYVDTKMLIKRGIIRMPNSRYDHAYHRPYGSSSKKFSNSHCLNNQSSKTKNNIKLPLTVSNCIKKNSKLHAKFNNLKNSSSLKCSYVNNKKNSKSKDIPVVDLTDSPPKSSVKGMKCVPANKKSSKWIFHCYGCGFKSNFVSESAVKSSGTEHMRNFHCVSDPESFLSFNTSSSGGILEAFPGYKHHSRD